MPTTSTSTNPDAIETFLLTTFLAFNLYHAFVARNLKPSLRRGKPRVFWARVMAAELYQAATGPSPEFGILNWPLSAP